MNKHLILSCHEDDYTTMLTLLAGMEAHSDFVTADMNELWRFEEARPHVVDMMGPKPKRDAWHGFIFPGFPFETLLSLLESAPWQRVEKLNFVLLDEDEVLIFTLPHFAKAIRAKFVTA